jgi:hypothetical protein
LSTDLTFSPQTGSKSARVKTGFLYKFKTRFV